MAPKVIPTQTAMAVRVAEYYLSSRDFNGYPVDILARDFDIPQEQALAVVASLVARGRISVVTSHEDNPHIKRFPSLPKEKQLELLATSDPRHTCIYPSEPYLKRVVKPTQYKGRPFTLRLAHGEPQLAFAVFDLTVLEAYRNDPRYYYYADDISGRISMHSKPGRKLSKSNQVLLETFGFAYSSNLDRAVAVFLRYLSDLSPEHQRIWEAKSLPRHRYKLHPDYYRSSILGQWYEGISVFDAVLQEIRCINEMCKHIGWVALFRNDYHEGKPAHLSFLLRPTLAEFNGFIHLLDKLLSENLNKEFFRGQLALEEESIRKDGKVEVRQKGTIQLLDEWLERSFRIPDRPPINEAIAAFKSVRKLRQKPAHAIDENVFDQKYYHDQRQLMKEVYGAVHTLRLAFANHPKARSVQVSRDLVEGTIWLQ